MRRRFVIPRILAVTVLACGPSQPKADAGPNCSIDSLGQQFSCGCCETDICDRLKQHPADVTRCAPIRSGSDTCECLVA